MNTSDKYISHDFSKEDFDIDEDFEILKNRGYKFATVFEYKNLTYVTGFKRRVDAVKEARLTLSSAYDIIHNHKII